MSEYRLCINKMHSFFCVLFITHLLVYPIAVTKTYFNLKQVKKSDSKGAIVMKGYNTENGYMGYVGGKYLLFASESDYYEWFED